MAIITRTYVGPRDIDDGAGFLTPLAIAGVPAGSTITKITVTLNITHTRTADLHLALRDPDNNSISLSVFRGGDGDNFTNTVFDDSATISIVAGSAPFTGTFDPELALSSLYPGTINGNWSLLVHDFNTGNTGTLNSWSISITYPAAPTAVAVTPVVGVLPEGTSVATRLKVANIAITDDEGGTNILSLTGADAAFFEIVGNALFLKAGTVLDFETKAVYGVAVRVNDPSLGGPVDATSPLYTLRVGDLTPEKLTGTALPDTLTGNSDVNPIFGLDGADIILGDAGNDTLVGGKGPDTMTGGPGEDIFDFDLKADPGKKPGACDRILDFLPGIDGFDLSDIDAKKGSGNQKFKFIGTKGFNDKKGELRYSKIDKPGTLSDLTVVSGDIDGNGKADFRIELVGVLSISKADFFL